MELNYAATVAGRAEHELAATAALVVPFASGSRLVVGLQRTLRSAAPGTNAVLAWKSAL